MCLSASRTQWLSQKRNLNVTLSEVSLRMCECSLLTWVGPVGLFSRSAVPVTDWPVMMLSFLPLSYCWNRKIMRMSFRVCDVTTWALVLMWAMWVWLISLNFLSVPNSPKRSSVLISLNILHKLSKYGVKKIYIYILVYICIPTIIKLYYTTPHSLVICIEISHLKIHIRRL